MIYKSCELLEKGIQFGQNTVCLCYQQSCIGGGYGNNPLITNFDGKNIDFDKINKIKKQLIENNKKGQYSPICEGCLELQEKDWPEFKGKYSHFNLDYWTWCNSNCVYCFTHNKKDYFNTQKHYNFYEILKKLKAQNLLLPNGFVNFGGGEVALLEEFDDLINTFVNYRYQVMVHTGAIDYLPVLERGLLLGKIFVVISIDAGTEETHAKVKEVRTFKKVWANVEKYAKFQKWPIQVKVKYIVVPGVNDDKKEILLWLKNAAKHGVKNVTMEIESYYLESNRNSSIPDEIYELFYYAKKEAEKLKLIFTLYDRSSQLMNENPKHKDYWQNNLNNTDRIDYEFRYKPLH